MRSSVRRGAAAALRKARSSMSRKAAQRRSRAEPQALLHRFGQSSKGSRHIGRDRQHRKTPQRRTAIFQLHGPCHPPLTRENPISAPFLLAQATRVWLGIFCNLRDGKREGALRFRPVSAQARRAQGVDSTRRRDFALFDQSFAMPIWSDLPGRKHAVRLQKRPTVKPGFASRPRRKPPANQK